MKCILFFFQAEDGIRDLVRSRGLGDVYKRQELRWQYIDNLAEPAANFQQKRFFLSAAHQARASILMRSCLLYTSDAADERSSVDLGGRRIIKKKKRVNAEWERILRKNKAKEEKCKHHSDSNDRVW